MSVRQLAAMSSCCIGEAPLMVLFLSGRPSDGRSAGPHATAGAAME
jgi:hypothetical protein